MKRILALTLMMLAALSVSPRPAGAETFLAGDMNGDGTVSAADAAMVLHAASGHILLDNADSITADVSGDMMVTSFDAQAIQLYASGFFSEFSSLSAIPADGLFRDSCLDKFFYRGVFASGAAYRTGQISIDVSTVRTSSAVAYVADIYLQDPAALSTGFSDREYLKSDSRAPVVDIAALYGGVLAIAGDNYSQHSAGPLVRNGVWYRDGFSISTDICVLFPDGVIKTYAAGKADRDGILGAEVAQSWVYGPRLLDGSGKALRYFTGSSKETKRTSRTVLGYYAPGHYCFVVVDGRANKGSQGMTLEELAAFMEQLGCLEAYNLCGGTTATMVLNGKVVNAVMGELRDVSDIVFIGAPPAA